MVSRMKGTYLAAQFRRIAARRGKGSARWSPSAIPCWSPSTICSHGEPYHELGAEYFDDRQRDHVQRRLVHRLERLGFAVTLEALTTTS